MMAFPILRNFLAKCPKSAFLKNPIGINRKLVESSNRMAVIAIPNITNRCHSTVTSEKLKKAQKPKFYGTSESESDDDLSPPGHRGESQFWRNKMRTFHKVLDVNKDGVISFDDFMLLGQRFIELGHLSEKHTEQFKKMLIDLWEKKWGPVNPYNLVTVEQFLMDMHHVINDEVLVRRAHSFLPYLFRAVDKDRSGEITQEEFKLFFECLGLEETDAVLAFRCIDSNHDGIITMREFVKHGREFLLSESEMTLSAYFFGPLVNH